MMHGCCEQQTGWRIGQPRNKTDNGEDVLWTG